MVSSSKKKWENKKRQRDIFLARTLRERCQLLASAKRLSSASSLSFFIFFLYREQIDELLVQSASQQRRAWRC